MLSENWALFAFKEVVSIAVEDLSDSEIIDPEALRLIVNAILIARYGMAAFQIKNRGAAYEK